MTGGDEMSSREQRLKRCVIGVAAAVGTTIAGVQAWADICSYQHYDTATLEIVTMTVDGAEVVSPHGDWQVQLRGESAEVILRGVDEVTGNIDHQERYVLDQN
jgi:hypothetical protein